MGTSSSKAVPVALAAMFAVVLAVGLCAVALAVVLVVGYGGGVAAAVVTLAFLGVFAGTWWLLKSRRASENGA